MLIELLEYVLPGTIGGVMLCLSTRFLSSKKKSKEPLPSDVFKFFLTSPYDGTKSYNCPACTVEQTYKVGKFANICECLDFAISEKHYHLDCIACKYKFVMLTNIK